MTNAGTEKPRTESPITKRSIQEPRLEAAVTPSGTAMSTARISVQVASASVGSRRAVISSATVLLKKNDSPKSPRRMRPIQMTNCWAMGWSRPSFSRMSATSLAVALSPAMIAAGSPAVKRSRRKTKTATVAITGTVARRRRPIYGSMRGDAGGARPAGKPRSARAAEPAATQLLLNLDVPEGRHRSLDHAGHVLPHRDGAVPVAERDVGRVLHEPHLHGLGDGFLLGRIGFARELVAQRLHLLVARPAQNRPFAGAVQEARHDVIEYIGRHPRGQERVPAAGRWRVLLGAARDERLPVHRLHVDLEARALQQRLGHGREVGQHGEVGRVHEHDRRAIVSGLLQQRPRLSDVRLDEEAGVEALPRLERRA